MWKCKKCGGERIIKKEKTINYFDIYDNPMEKAWSWDEEHSSYFCSICISEDESLDNVAYWEDNNGQ